MIVFCPGARGDDIVEIVPGQGEIAGGRAGVDILDIGLQGDGGGIVAAVDQRIVPVGARRGIGGRGIGYLDLVAEALDADLGEVDGGEGNAVRLFGDDPDRRAGRQGGIAVGNGVRAVQHVAQDACRKRGGHRHLGELGVVAGAVTRGDGIAAPDVGNLELQGDDLAAQGHGIAVVSEARKPGSVTEASTV